MRDTIESEELDYAEIPGYMELAKAAQQNVLTVEKVHSLIKQLKNEVEKELTDIKETPQTWISFLAFCIPVYGLIRKWYEDQRKLYLQARLKNLTMITAIFTNADSVQKKLEEQMANLRQTTQKYADERRWMRNGQAQ